MHRLVADPNCSSGIKNPAAHGKVKRRGWNREEANPYTIIPLASFCQALIPGTSPFSPDRRGGYDGICMLFN